MDCEDNNSKRIWLHTTWAKNEKMTLSGNWERERSLTEEINYKTERWESKNKSKTLDRTIFKSIEQSGTGEKESVWMQEKIKPIAKCHPITLTRINNKFNTFSA